MAERVAPDLRETLLKMAEVWLELASNTVPSGQRTGPDQNAPSSNQVQ